MLFQSAPSATLSRTAFRDRRYIRIEAQPRERLGYCFRYKDDRYGNASRVEAIPQFDARTIVQVDVENDANRAFEIGV
jgi:hypothetical protein